MFDDLDPRDFEATARSAVESCAAQDDLRARARLLAEAGLLGVIAPESVGGLGLPLDFALPVAAAAGEGLLAFPLIETLLLARALASAAPQLAAGVVAGEVLVSIAWGGTLEAGLACDAPLGAVADHVLVLRADGGAVLVAASGLRPADAQPFDVDAPEAALALAPGFGGLELEPELVALLRAEAQLLRAAFLQGSAARCLALAAEHAQTRVQFGKPLSANQVLRHRLSRDALAVETMRSGLARAVSAAGQGGPMAAEAAWLCAAQSAPGVAESAIQLLGGMGFTWEVPLHRHLRQMHCQARYGAAAAGLAGLGEALVAGSSNPWYAEIANAV